TSSTGPSTTAAVTSPPWKHPTSSSTTSAPSSAASARTLGSGGRERLHLRRDELHGLARREPREPVDALGVAADDDAEGAPLDAVDDLAGGVGCRREPGRHVPRVLGLAGHHGAGVVGDGGRDPTGDDRR